MQVYASLDDHLPLSDVPGYVRRVEAMGYDGIHVPETVHDVFLTALLAIQSSQNLTVRTSVAVAFPRSPMVVALAAWDLARLSQGRFSLGLGTQVRGNIEGRYATAWSDPVGRMREYVESLRAIFACFSSGKPLAYDGAHYRFTRLQPYFNPGAHDHPDIPILLGGVNAQLCQLAGEVADGLVTHPTSWLPAVLERIVGDVRAGQHRAGRAEGSTQLIASSQFVTGADAAALERNRETKRRSLAFLYSTPAYRPALETVGLADRADRLHALARAHEWEEMAAAVDDEMLEAVAPSATYDHLAALLLSRNGGRADALVLTPPTSSAEDAEMAAVLETLRQA